MIQRFNKVDADSLGKTLKRGKSPVRSGNITTANKDVPKTLRSLQRSRGTIVTNNFMEIHFNISVKLPNSRKCELKNGPKKNRNSEYFYQNEMLSHTK